MLTDPEAPALPPQPRRWSLSKIIFWTFGSLTVLMMGLLLYDENLEAFEDLKPIRTEAPDATTNGFLYLKERWEKLPAPSKEDREYSRKMLQDTVPWDEAHVTKMLRGRETAWPELKTALAMPEWVVPPELDYRNTPVTNYSQWLIPIYSAVSLESYNSARIGKFPEALEKLEGLQNLSTRMRNGSSNLLPNLVGGSLYAQSVILGSDLIAQNTLDAAAMAKLADLWKSDPPALAPIRQAMAGETAHFASMVVNFRRICHSPAGGKGIQRFGWLLCKTNQTLNQYHREMRTVTDAMLKPYPSRAAAEAALTPARPKKSSLFPEWMDPNLMGKSLVNSASSYTKLALGLPQSLFYPRAMRVKIALHQWQAMHEGKLPDNLDALVPDYLPEVPADPWNGSHLMWDTSAGIIYAVGSDWIPDLPVFNSTKREWHTPNNESPGLRLYLPPGPPP